MNDSESRHNPDLQRDQNSRIQTVDDLDFQLVQPGEPDFDTAIEIYQTKGEASPESMTQKAKEEFKRSKWWLQEYWQEKGIPKEQITIRAGAISAELYNYGSELRPDQVAELEKIMTTLGAIPLPDQLQSVKYILLDNKTKINPNNDEEQRGNAFRSQGMLALYPRAMSDESHRIPNTTSFAGTLVHEYGHPLQQEGDFLDMWTKTFGWKLKPYEEVDWSKEVPKRYTSDQLDRCVSDYAKISPDEDICESLVAAVNNPDALDPERLKFIQDRWLKNVNPESAPQASLTIRSGNDVELPRTQDVIKYKVKVSKFKTAKP